MERAGVTPGLPAAEADSIRILPSREKRVSRPCSNSLLSSWSLNQEDLVVLEQLIEGGWSKYHLIVGRLIYSMSVSLDCFVETPSQSLDGVRVDEELHAFCATKLGSRLDEGAFTSEPRWVSGRRSLRRLVGKDQDARGCRLGVDQPQRGR